MNLSRNIAVIGGGASGFMAAITAKETNISSNVTIFEKTDKLLAKVKISGGGRCNVTNATYSLSKLIKSYPRGGKQLKKSFNIFNTKNTVDWFESKGVKLKTEEDNRIFPLSNNSESIVNILINTAEELAIRVSVKSNVSEIHLSKQGFILNINNEKLLFEKIIIASGGSAKSSGFEWISSLGYKIINPVPSLFTFNMPKNPITKLM
ncbi:MAG: aminoacetone oxidase family FAD-binding enzyme, partial [Flavobacteriales bacterium]|nr:aminoacetone oxidase family FAD-binding enzyme [Flavobacteriales bacterium]